jgi:coenzyme F420-reducing hydrogenase delta subunit
VRCQKVIEETWEILRLLGIDERRLRLKWISASEGAAFAEEILKWISASEGAAFAEEIQNFFELLKTLGENPLKVNGDPPIDLHTMMDS